MKLWLREFAGSIVNNASVNVSNRSLAAFFAQHVFDLRIDSPVEI
jgi:hypothetical protein